MKCIHCHLGSWDGLIETYEKLNKWSEEHGYEPEGNALERPLWWDFSPKDDEIIMEIALPIKGDCEQTILLRKLREETGACKYQGKTKLKKKCDRKIRPNLVRDLI